MGWKTRQETAMSNEKEMNTGIHDQLWSLCCCLGRLRQLNEKLEAGVFDDHSVALDFYAEEVKGLLTAIEDLSRLYASLNE